MQASISESDERAIIKACRRGDLPALKANLGGQALPAHAYVNRIRTRADETLLHLCAVSDGDAKGTLQELLQAGGDVHARGFRTHAKTTLHECARLDRAELVTVLLQAGANINAVKSGDWTPLMLASNRGYTRTVTELLHHGANTSLRNRDGASALHLASRSGNPACVRVLLAHGADVKAVCRNGRTVLHAAVRAGCAETVRMLVCAGVERDAPDVGGMSAAHEAACVGVWKCLREVAYDGMWDGDCGGLDVLHHAAVGGHAECAGELLRDLRRAGGLDVIRARVQAIEATGKNALTLALLNRHADVARVLIGFGARVQTEWLAAIRRRGLDDEFEDITRDGSQDADGVAD